MTGWHRTGVNKFLEKHLEKLVPRPSSNILVPLCGKSYDMKYLADQGHCVTGLEFTEKAILEFFQEHKLQFSKAETEDFTKFTAISTNIKILKGDFFLATKDVVGEVDAIWDRASLVAINPNEREKYAKTVMSLLSKISVYMIQCIDYNQNEHGGPPFAVDAGVVSGLYGDKFNIEFLCKELNHTDAARFDISSMVDLTFMLTAKSS